jgi:hypothetical protein
MTEWQILGHTEAAAPVGRRFKARAMTLTPLVRGGGYIDPAGADLSLLNGGRCPVLLDHTQSIRSVVGVVESAWFADDCVWVIARMGFGKEAELAWRNIEAGVWRNVSLAFRVDDMAQDGAQIVVRRWRPYELSLVWAGDVPDAQTDSYHDLAAIQRELSDRRRIEAERAAEAARQQAAERRSGIQRHYRNIAALLAPELGISAAEATAAADRVAEKVMEPIE